jgi:transposase
LVKKELHVRYDTKTVEVFHGNERVASHVRNYTSHGYTTQTAHMPKKHQKHAEWTPERIASWAKKTGDSTEKFVEAVMSSRAHPQQGFRSCLGVLRLAKRYSPERLELACKRALSIGAYNFKSVESILKNNLDQKPLPPNSKPSDEKSTLDVHENVRGKTYFQ